MKCNQCTALMINSVFCHEIGCPNMNARFDEDSESWVKTWECRECGDTIDAGERCNCGDPIEDEDGYPEDEDGYPEDEDGYPEDEDGYPEDEEEIA